MNRRTTLIAPLALVAGATLLPDRRAVASSELMSGGAFTRQLLQYGTLSIKTSYLARKRSTTTYVTAFALGEILEQVSIAQALTSTADPKPVALTADQKAALAMVEGAADDQFDTVYLTAQHQAHEELLNLGNAFLGSNPIYTNQLVHTALIASAFVKNHLYILEQLLAAGA